MPSTDDVTPATASSAGVSGNSETKRSKNKAKREFDWSKANFGHFVIKIAYVGTNYHGLAVQELASVPTVEAQLFEALIKTRLVQDRHSCKYSRCGRTDKGVHAAGNYISLNLRVKPAGDSGGGDYDYPSILNGVLPADIRALAAARAPSGFDARFSCLYRIYKYHFPIVGEDLERMNRAAQHFLGEHDFRNFCKIDVEHVTNFCRCMLKVSVKALAYGEVGEVLVVGTAFLWHQVRCMVAVLLLVGQGLEEPSVVAELLDIEKHPRKPLYDLADESGLVLFDCAFESCAFAPGPWTKDAQAPEVDQAVSEGTQSSAVNQFRQMRLQARRFSAVHDCLALGGCNTGAILPAEGRPKCEKYTGLMKRAKGPSLEEKQHAFEAKKRRKGEADESGTAAALGENEGE